MSAIDLKPYHGAPGSHHTCVTDRSYLHASEPTPLLFMHSTEWLTPRLLCCCY